MVCLSASSSLSMQGGHSHSRGLEHDVYFVAGVGCVVRIATDNFYWVCSSRTVFFAPHFTHGTGQETSARHTHHARAPRHAFPIIEVKLGIVEFASNGWLPVSPCADLTRLHRQAEMGTFGIDSEKLATLVRYNDGTLGCVDNLAINYFTSGSCEDVTINSGASAGASIVKNKALRRNQANSQ
jgi:hypothetical protein